MAAAEQWQQSSGSGGSGGGISAAASSRAAGWQDGSCDSRAVLAAEQPWQQRQSGRAAEQRHGKGGAEAMAGRWRWQQRGSGNSGNGSGRATEAARQQRSNGSRAEAVEAAVAATQQAESSRVAGWQDIGGRGGSRAVAAEAAWQWQSLHKGSGSSAEVAAG
jgi:hypothetical protein